MNSPPEKTWTIDESVDGDAILLIFSAVFNASAGTPVKSKVTFFDDFDSHLWKADYLLYKTDIQQFKLVNPAGKISDISATKNARFWWDFSDSKNVLQKIIGLRALIPVANLEFIEQQYFLYNEDQKIVAKACLTQLILEGSTFNYLTLQALRGYTKDYERAAKALSGLIKTEVNHFGFKSILLDHNVCAFVNNKKIEIVIDADASAEESVRAMALGLLDQAKIHVDGAISDIDTEFLHQFRVSLRKVRSLISLLKKSLPQKTIDVLRPKLSLIAQKTNKLRDLDVFLLDETKYRKLLPDTFDKGLSELYTLIQKQRKAEQKKLARYFSSESYMNDMAACAEELSLPLVYETDISRKPILKVAKKLLLNRYHKMFEISLGVSNQSADEDVHALRIEFKKFRYLIEFFIELLPKKEITSLVGDLKKIQAVLGDFNDYSTQIDFLKNYIDDDQIEMSKSLSGLIAILHQKQVEEKCKVNDILADFFTEKMTDKIDTIFGPTTQGDSK